MKKKMWHCKYCGNTQDAKDSVCRICGNDLVIYGDVVFEENEDEGNNKEIPTMIADLWQTGDNNVTPSQQQDMNYNNNTPSYQQDMNYNNVTPSYQQDMNYNNNTPSYQQDMKNDGGSSDGKKKKKTGIIALIAVIVVAVAAIAAVFLIKGNKGDEPKPTIHTIYSTTTTTEPITTKPTTTKPTTTAPTTSNPATVAGKAKLPHFGYFAADHIVDGNVDMRLEKPTAIAIGSVINGDMPIHVVWDYTNLLDEEYDFEFDDSGLCSDGNGVIVVIGNYEGSCDVDQVSYTFEDGRKVKGEVIIVFQTNTGDNSTVVVFYDKNSFEVCDPSRKTTIDLYEPYAAGFPDFEYYTDGLATEIDREYDSAENIHTVWYKISDDEREAVIDEYFDLIEDYYSYEINNSYDAQDWVGLAYTGTDYASSMTTTFTDGKEFSGDAVTIDVDYYSGYSVVEVSYVGDIRLVTPIYIYGV